MALTAMLMVLVAASPAAGGPGDVHEEVILPGHEDDARALLADVALPEGYAWRGPAIEIGDIRFWLVRDDEVRGELWLMPHARALAGAPRSHSFGIEILDPEDPPPSVDERALMLAARASVQAHDEGGFYVERQAPPSLDRPKEAAADPEAVHRRWYAELGAFGLLGLVALGATLRRPPATAG